MHENIVFIHQNLEKFINFVLKCPMNPIYQYCIFICCNSPNQQISLEIIGHLCHFNFYLFFKRLES